MSRGVAGSDTIAAIATPPGRGGVGVIRVSGPETRNISRAIIGSLPKPRYATLTNFADADGSVIDSGLALFFSGPKSFTGEDVLELHGHGGPVVMDLLLQRILRLGARIAQPGEFSERAFLNDKMDLSQAEAIADLIDAVSQQAAKGAMRSMQGAFSHEIQLLSGLIVNLRMYVEAAIDFPEEEIDFLADERVLGSVQEIETKLSAIVSNAEQGALLREGFSLAIVGRPNAGKSSLMNALTGRDSSIVTTVPGTTRDVVREEIQIDGMPVHLIDTAGIRVSEDEVEIEGIKRAVVEAERADQVLIVIDLAEHRDDWQKTANDILEGLPQTTRSTLVLNKADLVTDAAISDEAVIVVSAKTGSGVDSLRRRIAELAGKRDSFEGLFSARRRHLDALARATAHVSAGREQLESSGAGELLAEELREAHEALCEITGEFTSDDLLGKIFSSFCIGK